MPQLGAQALRHLRGRQPFAQQLESACLLVRQRNLVRLQFGDSELAAVLAQLGYQLFSSRPGQ